jgi:mannose-6-phosphate isomerase-like protein (cupin superfamily)
MPTGEVVTIRRDGAGSGGAVFEFEAVLPPRFAGPPAHWHRVEQEAFDVVEGTLQVRIGRDSREVGPGESVTVAPGTVHGFANRSDQPVRVVTRETPAGQLEAQFRVLATAGRLPPLLRLARVNVEHDLTFFLAGVPELPQRVLWRALAGLARFRSSFT